MKNENHNCLRTTSKILPVKKTSLAVTWQYAEYSKVVAKAAPVNCCCTKCTKKKTK